MTFNITYVKPDAICLDTLGKVCFFRIWLNFLFCVTRVLNDIRVSSFTEWTFFKVQTHASFKHSLHDYNIRWHCRCFWVSSHSSELRFLDCREALSVCVFVETGSTAGRVNPVFMSWAAAPVWPPVLMPCFNIVSVFQLQYFL